MGTNFAIVFDATPPDAMGIGQESPLASPPADLHAPVLAMLAELPLYIEGGRYKDDTHVVTVDLLAPCSGASHPASPGDEAGVVEGDSKDSEGHAHSSGDAGVVEVGLMPD